MNQTKRFLFGLFTALAVTMAHGADIGPVPAASIDDGLGELPHYSQWQEPWLYAMPAEDIDSGLGEMPHVSQIVAVWLYAHPAESIDAGLGEVAAVSRLHSGPRVETN
jgi:hypothetical protein